MRERHATMNKSRNGTCVLGGLVAIQVCSMPELVNSERVLHFATVALLGYVTFAIVLLGFAARNARPLGFRPRFWTFANSAALIFLGIATWVAWRTSYCKYEVATAAAALVAALIHLYRRKARNQTASKTCICQNERRALL